MFESTAKRARLHSLKEKIQVPLYGSTININPGFKKFETNNKNELRTHGPIGKRLHLAVKPLVAGLNSTVLIQASWVFVTYYNYYHRFFCTHSIIEIWRVDYYGRWFPPKWDTGGLFLFRASFFLYGMFYGTKNKYEICERHHVRL